MWVAMHVKLCRWYNQKIFLTTAFMGLLEGIWTHQERCQNIQPYPYAPQNLFFSRTNTEKLEIENDLEAIIVIGIIGRSQHFSVTH